MAVDIKISPENLLPWSNFEDWENGTSSAPTEHNLSGGGAAIARESTIIKIGTYSAKVTRSGNDVILSFDLPNPSDYYGRKLTLGCWVHASVASRARIAINDGIASSNSSYHTGGGDWEFLEVTRDIQISATQIRVEFQINTGDTVAYFDSAILCEGERTFTILTDIADIGGWQPIDRYRGQSHRPARREGVRIPNMVRESKTINVSGMIAQATNALARTNMDTLNEIINSNIVKPNGDRELKDLYLFDDRLIKVFLNSSDIKGRAALKVLDFRLRFIAPDPFFQSINKTRKSNTISATPTDLSLTNNGNLFARPIITITNTSSNITSLTVENFTSDQSFSFTGSLVTSQSLVIDTELLTVENNGADAFADFTGDSDMIILPGDNDIRITGLVAGTIKIDWFDRWL